MTGLLLWAWCVPMAGEALAVSQAEAASVEHKVKAAFVLNFAKFIEWQEGSFENPNASIRLGILGEGPIDEPLLDLNGSEVQGRRLNISKITGFKDIRKYNIIFINPSEKGRNKTLLKALEGSGILVIGDSAGFAEQGGTINFYLDGGKVRFEINNCAARRENIRISSKLLRLARVVCSPNN